MTRVRLVSFADSANEQALLRIRTQALETGVFDDVHTLSEQDLNREFLGRHGHRLVPGSRGFGYWRWKPQVVLQGLRGLTDGDVLVYVDAGCHINAQGRQRFEFYVNRVANSELGFLGFQARLPEPPLIYDGRPLPEYLEAHWTKGDLLDRLNCRGKPWVTQTPQLGGTLLLVRADSAGVELVDDWLSIIDEDSSYVDDTPSVSENLGGFIEHRHDQSILSLLGKIKGVDTLSSFEYWYPTTDGRREDWPALRDFPIHARRDLKSRVSRPTAESSSDHQ